MTVFIQEQHGIGRITVWTAYDQNALVEQIKREFDGFNPKFKIYNDLGEFKEHLESQDLTFDTCDSHQLFDEDDYFVESVDPDGDHHPYQSYSHYSIWDAELAFWTELLEEGHDDQGVIIHYSNEEAAKYYHSEYITGFHLMNPLIEADGEKNNAKT